MSKHVIWYTRCPIPTASGVAYQRGSFRELFAGTNYDVRNIQELGAEHSNTHFNHTLDSSFREGGCAPPIWAYAGGASTKLLAISFMEEALRIYVRVGDPARTVAGLAGRRIAFPVWPKLIFNFFRFSAEKGFHSALEVHGLTAEDVEVVDVVESDDPAGFINPKTANQGWRNQRSYYHGQLRALLESRVDAIFAMGSEVATLERQANGSIRLLYDLREAPAISARVNNAVPRLLTVSESLLRDHREAVVRYLQTLVRTARWSVSHREEAVAAMAAEAGIFKDNLPNCFEADFLVKLMPKLDNSLLAAVEVAKGFLFERGYLPRDFSLDEWLEPGPLAEAYVREGVK